MANDTKPKIAPVDDYGKPSEVRSLEETILVEARIQEDQIPDYHQTHKTLDTSGPEHDPEVQNALREEALRTATGLSKTEAKKIAKEQKAAEGDTA